VQARRSLALADRELAFLQTVSDMPEIGNDERHACLPCLRVSAATLRHYAKWQARRSTRAGCVDNVMRTASPAAARLIGSFTSQSI